MDILIRKENGSTVVTMCTRLDTMNSGEFEKEISALTQETGAQVVFDCSHLGYISSAGLRVLLGVYKSIAANKGTFLMTHVNEDIKSVLDMTGFSKILKFETDSKKLL